MECQRILGVDVGATESYEFWKSFLRSLVKRGLHGVLLVVSDAHERLKKALAEGMTGAMWQRCRVHALRSILTHVPRQHQAMVLAAVKTIFVQSSHEEAHRQLKEVAKTLSEKCPKDRELLLDAASDVLANMNSPTERWVQIHSTSPLERLNVLVTPRGTAEESFLRGPMPPSAIREPTPPGHPRSDRRRRATLRIRRSFTATALHWSSSEVRARIAARRFAESFASASTWATIAARSFAGSCARIASSGSRIAASGASFPC